MSLENKLDMNLELDKDIEALCRYDNMIMATSQYELLQYADNMGKHIMEKYNISQTELKTKFMAYRAEELKQ